MFEQDIDTSIRVGVAAMDKKTNSKPMLEILSRLRAYGELECIVFGDEILSKKAEEWPAVDCLIAFFSQGFPIHEAWTYVNQTDNGKGCFCVNEIGMQLTLMDRWETSQVLTRHGIPTPSKVLVDRRNGASKCSLEEQLDYIIVNGKRLDKPFVEKPLSGEDHNIYIYYHSSDGGGSRRLFRKVKNASSRAYPFISNIRRDSSYIYESFVSTGTDIKVYTVGQEFAHAEARKAPTVDGVVERNVMGKEVRRVVRLSPQELAIASKVCSVFKQNVCGFDMLRFCDGTSYVIDVNGWSFVKQSPNYYSTCAHILRKMFLKETATLRASKILQSMRMLPKNFQLDQERNEILLGTAAVLRHADRTPKEKFKFLHRDSSLFSIFPGIKFRNLKLKSTIEFDLLRKWADSVLVKDPVSENAAILKSILDSPPKSLKIQLNAVSTEKDCDCSDVEVIVKWGGEITEMGIRQAEQYGNDFRKEFLPLGHEENVTTFLSHMKVFVSDQDRVKLTARAFCHGLSKWETVHEFKSQSALNEQVLDSEFLEVVSQAKKELKIIQKRLENDLRAYVQSKDDPLFSSLEERASWHGVHLKKELLRLPNLVKAFTSSIEASEEFVCGNRLVTLMLLRWKRFMNDIEASDGFTTVSSICDMYDCIQFEALHNRDLISSIPSFRTQFLRPLLECCSRIASVVVPCEYGIDEDQKKAIGEIIAGDIFHSITKSLKDCCGSSSKSRCFLYFTSETQINAIRNVLASLKISTNDLTHNYLCNSRLNYMSHFIFQFYVKPNSNPSSDGHDFDLKQCKLRILFSPGASKDPLTGYDGTSVDNLPVLIPTPVGTISASEAFLSLFPSLNT